MLEVKTSNVLSLIFSSYLLGASITGLYLKFSTFIIPLSFIHTAAICGFHCFIATVIRKKKNSGIEFTIDEDVWYYGLFLFVLGFSLKSFANVYKEYPYHVPYVISDQVEREISFIQSVRKGCNKYRFNMFFFNDPQIHNYTFAGFSIPLLFTAALMSLGASYPSASIIVSLCNTLAVFHGFIQIAKRLTSYYNLASLMFLLNGSWAGLLYFKSYHRMDNSNDLVHKLSKYAIIPWFHPINYMMCVEKSLSFSVALSVYSIMSTGDLLSYVFVIFIPSVLTSLSVLYTLLSFGIDSNMYAAAVVATLIKAFPYNIFYIPLHRDAQINGVFFAPAVIWLQALGPWIFLLFFVRRSNNAKLKRLFMSTMGSFFIMNFIREGRMYNHSVCAIYSNNYLFYCILCADTIKCLYYNIKDESVKGAYVFVIAFMFAFSIYGSMINLRRVAESLVVFYKDVDLECKKWLNKLKYKAIIFTATNKVSPVSISGRQNFLASKRELFNQGYSIVEHIDKYDKLKQASSHEEWYSITKAKYILEDKLNNFTTSLNGEILGENSRYRLKKITADKKVSQNTI